MNGSSHPKNENAWLGKTEVLARILALLPGAARSITPAQRPGCGSDSIPYGVMRDPKQKKPSGAYLLEIIMLCTQAEFAKMNPSLPRVGEATRGAGSQNPPFLLKIFTGVPINDNAHGTSPDETAGARGSIPIESRRRVRISDENHEGEEMMGADAPIPPVVMNSRRTKRTPVRRHQPFFLYSICPTVHREVPHARAQYHPFIMQVVFMVPVLSGSVHVHFSRAKKPYPRLTNHKERGKSGHRSAGTDPLMTRRTPYQSR